MAQTPTRPPNRPRNERRTPPKGPRTVPLSRKDQRTKDNLQAAAERLRAVGNPKYAAVVEGILTPSGAAFIQRLHSERIPTAMTVYMPEAERDHIRKAAEEAGENNLSALADEALHQFIHGQFRPGPYARATARTTSTNDERTLSLTVDRRLKDQAASLIKDPQFIKGLGWKPRGTALLVRMFLQQQFPMFGDVDPAEVYRAHEAGASAEEIAERFGLDQGAVELLIEPRLGLSPVEEEEIIRRYDRDPEANGPYALAREFSVHPRTVMRLLDRFSKVRPTLDKG